jgi:hypothetical protein
VSEAWLAPPEGWELLEAEQPALIVAAAPPAPDARFRPNVVLTVAGPADAMRLEELVDGAIGRQEAELPGFHLIDRRSTALAGGRPCIHTLAHAVADERAVVVEQWRLIAGGRGHELTASCATLDYPLLNGDFAATAASLAIEDG